MEFSRQEYWSGLPFPSPGDLHNPGIEPGSPALQADALPSEPPGGLTFLTGYISKNGPQVLKRYKTNNKYFRVSQTDRGKIHNYKFSKLNNIKRG